MTLVYITVWRLYSLVFNKLDLSPFLLLLRVVDAVQRHQTHSRGIREGYVRWAYEELRLPIRGRHKVGDQLGFEHT